MDTASDRGQPGLCETLCWSLLGVMESEQSGNHAYVLNLQIHAAELNTAGSVLGPLKKFIKIQN